MMKKDNNGKTKSPKPSIQNIFGANPLQFGENDFSSIVGGIVEKGFSVEPSKIPEPRPSFLPFPVARHRSHGPHWAPRMNSDIDEADDGEDEDLAFYDPTGAFAKPIKRKQKKGLDFTRWRYLASRENSSLSSNKEETKVNGVRTKRSSVDDNVEKNDLKKEKTVSAKPEVLLESSIRVSEGVNCTLQSDNNLIHDVIRPGGNCIQLEKNPQYGMEEARDEIMEERDPFLKEASRQIHSDVQKNMSTSLVGPSFGFSKMRNEQVAKSIQSEIDTENRARLEGMSADEIAEARAELMAKMDPALLNILKKRGQDKLKKEKGVGLKMGTSSEVCVLQDEKVSINASKLPEGYTGKLATLDSKDKPKGAEREVVANLNPSNGKLWDAWSKNVEAARELRFSLDGNVVENDFARISNTGNTQSSYNSDNVAERDFLRTEGDPGAAGYTIKEALALTRSMVSAQRSIALHLLASVLGKAIDNICQNKIGCTLKKDTPENSIDWEAVWAFMLGPEPELALSLRMSLDDNNNSVVLACAKVIQCILCCDINEGFFDICEKISTREKETYTAPIFRSRPKIDEGFLHGGFWKYNSKPSNILPFSENTMDDDEPEGEHTIQDDVFVAGQDIVAGLVRMGILPRIRYLLETDPSAALEEKLISILIALVRHSPTCSDAIMRCERLVQVVVNRFTMKDQIEVNSSKTKSVTLIKVLAQSDKKKCKEFLENGIFHKMTWHLYRYAFSLDQWLNLSKEKCKHASALLVEQLRFWKVCIRNGYCVSNFADLFPALCNWLDVPTFDKLIENNVLSEFVSVTKEAYLVLEALTKTLPKMYSHLHTQSQTSEVASMDTEKWCWSHVGPMVDLALKWISLESDPYLSKFFALQKENKTSSAVQNVTSSSLLWVISDVLKMLSCVLLSVIPDDKSTLPDGFLPWLPEFVPKIGLVIIKNGFLNFSEVNAKGCEEDDTSSVSFLKFLCDLRHQSDNETAVASVCCINGLVQVVVSVDKLIQLANTQINTQSSQNRNLASREETILTCGIFECAMPEMRNLLTTFMNLIASEGRLVQCIEIFGRGGPAPGVGVGWGTSGGGFWSLSNLLAQTDAGLLLHLLEIFFDVSAKDPATDEYISFKMQIVNCALDMCLVLGPGDRIVMDKLFDLLFQPPVMECLEHCIDRFLRLNKGLTPFVGPYKDDYLMFSTTLAHHYKSRWLSVKKTKAEVKNKQADKKTFKKSKMSLDTIHEDVDMSDLTRQKHQSTSLVVNWAHQRLPLPMHWFVSPISTIDSSKLTDLPNTSTIPNSLPDIARAGIFFLLGLEAMSTVLSTDFHSSVQRVPIIWKLHSLSAILFSGTDILTNEKSRVMYENLQGYYGQLLDNSRSLEFGEKHSVEFLKFQTEIHDSYSTFTETFVEHFAGASYGDVLYGRQVAMYLHRCVEAPVRLAAWDALSNVRGLELLPSLYKCVANSEGYLEPPEIDEKILDAYVKSWVSGALDRALTRQSMSFTLALHHLSLFIFGDRTYDELPLRNKLVKSLLRDYSRKHLHEDMMVKLVQYKKAASSDIPGEDEDMSVEEGSEEVGKKVEILKEACEGNSSLLSVVEKLEKAARKENYKGLVLFP